MRHPDTSPRRFQAGDIIRMRHNWEAVYIGKEGFSNAANLSGQIAVIESGRDSHRQVGTTMLSPSGNLMFHNKSGLELYFNKLTTLENTLSRDSFFVVTRPNQSGWSKSKHSDSSSIPSHSFNPVELDITERGRLLSGHLSFQASHCDEKGLIKTDYPVRIVFGMKSKENPRGLTTDCYTGRSVTGMSTTLRPLTGKLAV